MLVKFQRASDGAEVVYEMPDRGRSYLLDRELGIGNMVAVRHRREDGTLQEWQLWRKTEWKNADSGDARILSKVPDGGEIDA